MIRNTKKPPNMEKPRQIQSIDSSLRGAQALKKKGRKGKWSAHVVRNGCAKKEGNEPFPLRREFFVVAVVVVVFCFDTLLGQE